MVHKSDYVTANGVPIVNPANIVNGTISSKNIMYISKDKSIELERYKLEVNDIVLARRGDLAKCTIVGNEQVDFICGTGSFFLHLISVLPQYFQLVYMSSYVQIILTTECVGATMNNLNQSVLSQILFPLPPLAEQKRVVARTKYMLSIITTLDNEQYSLHTTIKQAKAKVLDLAIHGKLVPQDPNDEPASELLKRINPKAEITCDTPQYGKLPKGWCLCKISSVVDIVNGKSQKNVESPTGKYPIYGSGGIIGKAMEYTCLAGSTIIGRKGTINHPIFVEENFWNVDTAFGMKANNQILEDKYFYCFCLYFDFSKLDKSSALPSLTKTAIGNLILPIPPLAEQQRIVAKIEELFSQLDKIESSLQA